MHYNVTLWDQRFRYLDQDELLYSGTDRAKAFRIMESESTNLEHGQEVIMTVSA